ncbi:protein kinase [Achlya hypogyna]|uniref:Protein kinase n=1 Tax=Achlya hypogyna TaxID=1202772 RepID=A0A1V9Z4P1_ACHHY|nr:protein kinase [Achlya hypogyna]
MGERKRLFLSNVPILSSLFRPLGVAQVALVDMAVANGASSQAILSALTPLHYTNGATIVRQGDSDSDIYFVESGTVQITRTKIKKQTKDDVQLSTRTEFEYFGEYAFAYMLTGQRTANAVAVGEVRCYSMSLDSCLQHLTSVRDLMRYRLQMRENGVLDNLNVFSALTPLQRGRMLGLSTLRAYEDGATVCKYGEIDDQYFVLVEVMPRAHVVLTGQAKICVRPNGVEVELLRKEAFQGFGEMGLFGKPRTADVIAVGSIVCIVMNRDSFIKAQSGGALESDAATLVTTVSHEWDVLKRLEAMHSNPRVVHHLERLVKRFQAVQTNKFAGKTLYTDLYRRVFANPKLALDFAPISNKIDWFDALQARKVIRFEAKRILATEPTKERPVDELAFLGRLAETSSLLDKFRVEGSTRRDGKFYMASQLARLMEFMTVKREQYIFKQNAVEGKAYIVLSGDVHVVFEDGGTSSHIVATLTGGDSFGELTLVTNMPRSASAVAATDVELILIQRRHFARFLHARPGFRIRHYLIERADFLHSLFPRADPKACIRVAFDMVEATYHAQHVFLRHGHHASTFCVVQEGLVGVFKPAPARGLVHVGNLGPQQYFGSSVFATAAVEDATFMATTAVTVLELSDAKARRMDTHMIDAATKALAARAQWEAAAAARADPALLYDPHTPWAFLGDDRTQLQLQVDRAEDARNTSCTRIVRDAKAPEARPAAPVRRPPLWSEPAFPLPTHEKGAKALLGSFLTKKLQSYQMVTAVVPEAVLVGPLQAAVHTEGPASLVHSVSHHHHRRGSSSWAPAADKPLPEPEDDVDWSAADWNWDVGADCDSMWKLDCVHEDNLYL